MIISISLGDEDLENLDTIRREYDLKGRSDAVRAALRKTAADLEEVRDLEGQVEGVLIAVRSDHADPWLNVIQSRHVSVVTTQLHSHLKDRRCLEVMVLSGSAEEIRSMLLDIEASGKAEYVRFVRRRSGIRGRSGDRSPRRVATRVAGPGTAPPSAALANFKYHRRHVADGIDARAADVLDTRRSASGMGPQWGFSDSGSGAARPTPY